MVGYLRERFPLGRFGPLAVFIATAGLAASPPAQAWRWALAAAQALTLILQFRLWDDIADRNHDRYVHPQRVLSQTSDLRPFLVLAAALFVCNGLLLAGQQNQGVRTVAYLALCAGLLAWYRLRPAAVRGGLLNTHLVLLKYPVIAGLIGATTGNPDPVLVLYCLLSVYLIFVIFDIFDDVGLRHLPGAFPSLATALGLMVGVWILIGLHSCPHARPLPCLIWASIVAASLVLGLAGLSIRRQRTVFRGGGGFFIIGLMAYLVLAAGKSL